jgi:hypothetical protein
MSRYDRPYLDQSRSHGLPGDEYRNLCRTQGRDRLETYFEHRGNVRTPYVAPYSAYREAGLSQGECFRVSEARSATRAALGGSFDFHDEGHKRSLRREAEYQRSRGWIDDNGTRRHPIPKKYLNEFNRKWHEDDEDNDADQYLADHTREAPWRKHVLPENNRVYIDPLHTIRPRTSAAPSRTDSGYASSEFMGPRSPPIGKLALPPSKFSFDICEKLSREWRYLGRFRRH